MQRQVMIGPQQQHPTPPLSATQRLTQQVVAAGGHRTGIDKAGVGHDQRPRHRPLGRILGQQLLDHLAQGIGLGRIEQAGHRRRTNMIHTDLSRAYIDLEL